MSQMSQLDSARHRPRPADAPFRAPAGVAFAAGGWRAPDPGPWGKRFQQLKEIDATHQKYRDIETPLIPPDIIQGARRLIRRLEDQGVPPPTCMGGTVDATVCLEWHDWNDSGKSMTIDVLGYDQLERFYYTQDGKPEIAIEAF